MIAKTLKLPENQRTEDLSVSIQEKLRETDKVIIIDEAQNLKFLTLEEIRGWVDEDIFTGKPGIGIVLIGNVEVYNKMLGKQEAIFAQTKHSDFSAIITLAKHKVSGYMYVMDADIERRHPDKIIGDILEKEKMLRRDYGRGYKKFGAETVQFQWFLKEELAKASAKAGLYLPIEEVPQTSDKTMRIQTMQPDVKNHYIKFNKRHKRLLEQMEHFPMGAHDDGVDALEGCRTIAKKMKRFRVLDKGKLGL